ncbi:transposase [Corynebacterium phoceense]
MVTGGQRHGGMVLPDVLEELRVPQLSGVGRLCVRRDVVLADRASSSVAHWDLCRRRRIKCVSPERKDQVDYHKRTGAKGWCPPKLDANRYKDRNIVEQFFSRATQWMGLTIRCENIAINYRGGMVLFAVCDWLQPNEETPPRTPRSNLESSCTARQSRHRGRRCRWWYRR